MSAQIKDGGAVDVLAVLDAEIACKRIAVANGYSSEEVLNETEETRAAMAELIYKADTAATVLSNLIAAGQVDAGYSGYVTDLTAALANVGGAK